MTYQSGGIAVASLTGSETVEVGTTGPQITTATTQQIANLAQVSSLAITALNTVGAGTITAAGIAGGITARGGAQGGTAFTDTTDTAIAIVAALPAGTPVGRKQLYRYENNTNAAATLTNGVGVTITGTAYIPQGQWAEYLLTEVSATAVTLTYMFGGSVVPLPPSKVSSDGAAGSTANVAGLSGAQTVNLVLTAGTPGTVAIGPAAALIAALPSAIPGLNYILNIRNQALTTATLSGLSGVSIAGTGATIISGSTTRSYNVSFDSLSSATLTGLSSSSI